MEGGSGILHQECGVWGVGGKPEFHPYHNQNPPITTRTPLSQPKNTKIRREHPYHNQKLPITTRNTPITTRNTPIATRNTQPLFFIEAPAANSNPAKTAATVLQRQQFGGEGVAAGQFWGLSLANPPQHPPSRTRSRRSAPQPPSGGSRARWFGRIYIYIYIYIYMPL